MNSQKKIEVRDKMRKRHSAHSDIITVRIDVDPNINFSSAPTIDLVSLFFLRESEHHHVVGDNPSVRRPSTHFKIRHSLLALYWLLRVAS